MYLSLYEVHVVTKIRAVVFDFIGTLTELVGYSLEKAEDKMYWSLIESGYRINREEFFKAYKMMHQKYREIRYGQLVEVTNAVWLSEALNHLGYATTQEEERIKTAINVFFEDYLSALKLRPHAKPTLKKLFPNYILGIISNFTYAPVIYGGLRKLKINNLFSAKLVSDAVGWRKPSPRIFQEAFKRLHVKAVDTLLVGDNPIEDIQGAQNVGMKTVFIPSQFNSLNDMQKEAQQPDYIIQKLCDIPRLLDAQ